MIIIQIRFQRRVDVSLHYVQSYENGFTAAAVNDFSARRNYFWRPLKTFAAAAVNRVQPSSLPSTTVLSPFKVRPLSLQRPSPPPSKSVLSEGVSWAIIFDYPQLTLKGSPLSNRRSERPADKAVEEASTLKECPNAAKTGKLLRVTQKIVPKIVPKTNFSRFFLGRFAKSIYLCTQVRGKGLRILNGYRYGRQHHSQDRKTAATPSYTCFNG